MRSRRRRRSPPRSHAMRRSPPKVTRSSWRRSPAALRRRAKPSALARIVHGTTVATNTALERDGARLAVLVTAGHKDVLVVGRGNRTAMYDIKARPPDLLVPRSRCIEVHERMRVDGSVAR